MSTMSKDNRAVWVWAVFSLGPALLLASGFSSDTTLTLLLLGGSVISVVAALFMAKYRR